MGPSIGMNQSMENHTVENWKENLLKLTSKRIPSFTEAKRCKVSTSSKEDFISHTANILPGTTRRSKGDVGTKINSLLNGLYADKFVEDAFFLKIVTICSQKKKTLKETSGTKLSLRKAQTKFKNRSISCPRGYVAESICRSARENTGFSGKVGHWWIIS